MNILVICQYYYPEPFAVSYVCEELVRSGHSVTVYTGTPNYPDGRIYPGYRRNKKKHELLNGVKVNRCFCIGRRNNVIFRALNYVSFAVSSVFNVLRDDFAYDAVLVYQLSPVLMALAGVVYKIKHKAPLILYCLDLWPASLLAGGVSKKSLVYKAFHKISEKIYVQADRILISSKLFARYFNDEFGIVISDEWYLPQFAEDIFEKTENTVGGEKNTVDFVFAGNIGSVQRIDTVIGAALLTKDIKTLKWHIAGDGSQLLSCIETAHRLGVDNVIFHGRMDEKSMADIYSIADAMLVTLGNCGELSYTLPRKVQSYMAAGKPIICAADGAAAELINEAECGICVEAESAEDFAAAVRTFIKSENKTELGENGRTYYRNNFTKQIFTERLLCHLENLKSKEIL